LAVAVVTFTAAASAIAEKPSSIEATVASAVSVAKHALAWPFDTMRDQYANAVRAGLVERSLIAAAQFERKVAVLEQSLLGACARHV
jgi:non-canonical (house-cleaning) NTP pyrophosphatase